MDESTIRAIVQDELQKNSKAGDPNVAPHEHNGNDNLKISPLNLEGVSSVPSGNRKYLNPLSQLTELGFAANLTGGDGSHDSQSFANPELIFLTQIPIIQGNGVGVQSAFNGGYAPDGTVVLFANGSTLSKLNIRYGGEWYQFNVDSII